MRPAVLTAVTVVSSKVTSENGLDQLEVAIHSKVPSSSSRVRATQPMLP